MRKMKNILGGEEFRCGILFDRDSTSPPFAPDLVPSIVMWEIRISHEGLHTYRVVRGVSQEEAELKARLQSEAWQTRWNRIQEIEAERKERLNRRSVWDQQVEFDKRAKNHALELTREAESHIQAVTNLLSNSLKKSHALDWEALKDRIPFTKDRPAAPALQSLPVEPSRSEDRFKTQQVIPTIRFFDWIVPGARAKIIEAARMLEQKWKAESDQKFDVEHRNWKMHTDSNAQLNQTALTDHEKAKAAWLLEKHIFEEQQKHYNQGIDTFREQYLNRDPESVVRYCTEVVARSEYPDAFPRDNEISFDIETGLLGIDFELPPQSAIPKKKQVKYVANRGEFQDTFISDSAFKKLYDDVLYQVCLSTLHELFSSDIIDVLKTVVFNGWVHAIDRATGADTHLCIMTVQVMKKEFVTINLGKIDLKACFRSLKGISGSSLSDFSPVRPVLTLNREDSRFVAPYNVADSLNDRTNLAAMDWLDFENLIRELFEKEFSKNGGEVKITQASRDGGVDAVAFDPDPIRGGKIVIQAKRYTNPVGVAAVRDLFGTVHNEGATKGILVTTSDYGPDAYEFAKGKPLTLLSGSELLYLLGRHGYRAKIDIKEAKKLLGEI
jgi:restriction system protein